MSVLSELNAKDPRRLAQRGRQGQVSAESAPRLPPGATITEQLQPIKTAPKDGRRVRLEAELASDRGENAFNGPVYGVWSEVEQRWLLSPYIEDTIIDDVEGWWPEEDKPALHLEPGDAPGTVAVTKVWTGGDIRTEIVTPDQARQIFQHYGVPINEDHLARCCKSAALRVVK